MLPSPFLLIPQFDTPFIGLTWWNRLPRHMLNPGIRASGAKAGALPARIVGGPAFGEPRISQRVERPGGNGGERFEVNGARNEFGKG